MTTGPSAFWPGLPVAVGLLALSAWLLAALPGPAAGTPRLAVKSQVGIREYGIPLDRLLDEIGHAGGPTVRVDEAAPDARPGEPIAITVDDPAVHEALRHLLRHRDHVLIVSPTGGIEIRIYGTAQDRLVPAVPPTARALAASSTGAEDTRDPIQLRADAIIDGDPHERSLALDRLVGAEDGEVVTSTALAVLERERDPQVIEAALDLLDGLETVPLDAIIGWVAKPHEPALRVRALTMLRERGENDGRVRKLLGALGRQEQDEAVRTAARTLLGELDGTRRHAR